VRPIRFLALVSALSVLAIAVAAQTTPPAVLVATGTPAVDVRGSEAGVSSSRELHNLMLARPVPQGISQRCASGEATKKECNFHWVGFTRGALEFLTMEHVMNTPTYNVDRTHFVRGWMNAVDHQAFNRWNDGDPFIVDYVGHPMSGAVVGFMQIENDPKGQTLEIGKSSAYWKSRGRAVLASAVYSTQWEIGPFSEASLGHLGSFNYYSKASHSTTNGTGMVDFIITPMGGAVWMVGEDMVDKYFLKHFEETKHNPASLLGVSILSPNRSLANLLRFKLPWYRDSRHVQAGW
jgi:hypothetical protein